MAKWWDDKYNKWLVAIMVLAVIVRIYILIISAHQPLWWDEAGYLAKTKKIVLGWTWTDFWNPHKPILITWLAVPFFKFGLGEVGLRIFIMLLSILGVYMTYAACKEFFDKKIALTAALLMSVFWVSLFFSARILTDLPASVFLLISVYYFSKGYVKSQDKKYLMLSGLFLGLTFLMRVSIGVMIFPFLLYFFSEERLKFLKNKNIWMAIFVMFLVILPFLIWLYASYPAESNSGLFSKIYKPIDTFMGFSMGRFTTVSQGGGTLGIGGIWAYMKNQPYVFGPVLSWHSSLIRLLEYIPFLFLLAGFLILLSDLILGADLIFKKENKSLRLKLFIMAAIILIFLTFGPTRGYVEQRDMIYISPFLFCAFGIALYKFQDFLNKYSKAAGIIMVLIVLLLAVYFQLSWGVNLTKSKSTSYLPVKESSLFMKENSAPSDLIYTESKMQNLYYAERYTLAYGSREGYDPFANKTEQDFFKEVSEKKPKFIVISVFEGHATWMYSNCGLPANLNQFCPFMWAEQHNSTIKPVKVWYDSSSNQQVPVLVVYGFENYNFKNA